MAKGQKTKARQEMFLEAISVADIESGKKYEECTDFQKGIFTGTIIGIVLARKRFMPTDYAKEVEEEIRKIYFPLWNSEKLKL